MDRRIKAILLANNLDVKTIKIVGVNDDTLEVIKDGKTLNVTLDGVKEIVISETIVDIISQEEKLEQVKKEAKEDKLFTTTTTTTIINEIMEDVDDNDIFDTDININIDNFDVNIEDDFNFDDDAGNEPDAKEKIKSEKPKKIKKSKRTKKSKKGDDDFINLI